MKKAIYFLVLFLSVFIFNDVVAAVEYSCPEGFDLNGKQCVKKTPAVEGDGYFSCPEGGSYVGNNECSLTIDANAAYDRNDFNIQFDNPYQEVGSNNANCDTLGLLRKDLNSVFNIIKIVAPILVIIFSIYDFIKAAVGKVDGETKKAFGKLMKRILFAIIIFFLPTILDFFLGLVNSGYTTCING